MGFVTNKMVENGEVVAFDHTLEISKIPSFPRDPKAKDNKFWENIWYLVCGDESVFQQRLTNRKNERFVFRSARDIIQGKQTTFTPQKVKSLCASSEEVCEMVNLYNRFILEYLRQTFSSFERRAITLETPGEFYVTWICADSLSEQDPENLRSWIFGYL